MTESRHDQASRIFAEALSLPAADRPQYIDGACGDDADLRSFVLDLLRHDSMSFGVLDDAEALLPAATEDQSLPERIGPYRVRRRVGAGGMGVVYEAEQQSPQRRVALKVIRADTSASETVQRFAREARILGRLEHEGIARIYEAGSYEVDGISRPFLTMEFIEGERLDQHARNLGFEARLDLFARICDAVDHAHQGGVIHRDLKPANILVTPEGRPKILDFGVARLVDSGGGPETLQTNVGQIVGTLSHMSPEQTTGRSAEVDARSDVYALGIILFQLIAEEPPYDLTGLDTHAAIRVIQDVEPRRLNPSGAGYQKDLDVLVRRALEKDREQRCQSAAELAADVRRFLRDEPILARPSSAIYQLRKFVRRNRAMAAGIAVALVALVAAAAVSFQFAIEAGQQRDLAGVEAAVAREERDRAADEARTSRRFVRTIIRTFKQLDPAVAQGGEVSLLDALDAVSERIDEDLANDPLVLARMHAFFGAEYESLGQYERAARHFDAAIAGHRKLGAQHRDAALAMSSRGWSLYRRGNRQEGQQLTREALEVLDRLQIGADELRARCLCNLAEIALYDNRLDEAQNHSQASLSMRRALFESDHEEIAIGLMICGQVASRQDRLVEAEGHLRASLAMRERLYGKTHLLVAESLQSLGNLLYKRGEQAQTLTMMSRVVDIKRKVWPEGHPSLASAMSNLGVLYQAAQQFEASTNHQEQAIEMMRKAYGPDAPDLINMLIQLGRVREARGQGKERHAALAEAVRICGAAFTRAHPLTYAAFIELGLACQDLERLDDVEQALLGALKTAKGLEPNPGTRTVRTMKRLLKLYEQQDRQEEVQHFKALLAPLIDKQNP